MNINIYRIYDRTEKRVKGVIQCENDVIAIQSLFDIINVQKASESVKDVEDYEIVCMAKITNVETEELDTAMVVKEMYIIDNLELLFKKVDKNKIKYNHEKIERRYL